MSNYADEVKKELEELQKLDVDVPDGAFRAVDENAAEWEANGLPVSEAADLARDLA